MYRSFELRHFRCFEHFRLDDLARVNLVIGKHNSGKTSLLEGVFLHMGWHNPELALRVNLFRGVDAMVADPREVWGWLFLGKDLRSAIELEGTDPEAGDTLLRISLADVQRVRIRGGPQRGASTNPAETTTTERQPGDLLFEYTQAGVPAVRGYARVGEQGLEFQGVPRGEGPLASFLSSRALFPHEDARRFSRLQEIGRQEEVLTVMREADERVRHIQVSVGAANQPELQCDIGLGRSVPMAFMGQGFARVLSMALAFSSAPGGVVLIDEIENGIHYSAMPKVWRAVASLAASHNVQVLATTHSWECLRYAHEAFSERLEYDLRMHRLELTPKGIQAVSLDREMIETALATGSEVR